MGQKIKFYCIIAFYKDQQGIQHSQIVQVPYLEEVPTLKEQGERATDLMGMLLQEGYKEIVLTLLIFKKEPPMKKLEAYAYEAIPVSDVMDFMDKYVESWKIFTEEPTE